MRTTPLHARFGVEVHGVDLRRVGARAGYPAIRAAFEEHSVLLFRGQDIDGGAQLAFCALFGPPEVRAKGPDKPPPAAWNISNVRADATLAPEDDNVVLNLKSNQLWHTDSTFLPVPALANVLVARVLPSQGGETEYASTRAAWADMPERLKARVRGAVLRHRYAHSRAKVSPALAREPLYTMWEDQTWPALWRNPVHGREALYIASHVCAVEGLPEDEGRALVDELMAFATRDDYVYTHRWRVGDVLMWDERATLHRGRPWPYGEARTLSSLRVSVQDADGLAAMRAGARPEVAAGA